MDERDWGAVKLLLDEFERELSERRSALLYRVSVWKMAVRILKRSTTEKMVLKTPDQRDIDYHRGALAYLKGSGLVLLGELKRHQKLDPAQIGITYESFSALVSELEYQEREWYGNMKPEFREALLEHVFSRPQDT